MCIHSPKKLMKTMFRLLALILILSVASSPCFAMMSIGTVSRDRAKALGLVIQSKPAGPDAVWVELTFETKGELERFLSVDLEITEGGKLLLSGALMDRRSSPGHVSVSFTAARAHLAEMTLRVEVGIPMNRSGYDLALKDFVESEKVH
jgi:hypothetical protein